MGTKNDKDLLYHHAKYGREGSWVARPL